MRCPNCLNTTKVKDSRLNLHNEIRRRRVCESCGYRFSTSEIPDSKEDQTRFQESTTAPEQVRNLLKKAMALIDQESSS